MSRTYYNILGVPVGATAEHIRDSYRLLTKKTIITDAVYEVLIDPIRRREYDLEIEMKQRQPAGRYFEGVAAGAETENTIGGPWVTQFGAPREMPRKPDITTQTELHYVQGVENLLKLGTLLHEVPDTILDSSPESLLESAGIHIETTTDAKFLIEWILWLEDLVNWTDSLSDELFHALLLSLQNASQRSVIWRFRFLTALADER
jgi:curved DNA-binding protein CbpA